MFFSLTRALQPPLPNKPGLAPWTRARIRGGLATSTLLNQHCEKIALASESFEASRQCSAILPGWMWPKDFYLRTNYPPPPPLPIFLEGYAFALNHPAHICVIWCVLNANIKVTACFDMMLLPQVFCGNQKTVRWHPKTKKAEPTKWWSLLFATGVEIIGNSNWFGF